MSSQDEGKLRRRLMKESLMSRYRSHAWHNDTEFNYRLHCEKFIESNPILYDLKENDKERFDALVTLINGHVRDFAKPNLLARAKRIADQTHSQQSRPHSLVSSVKSSFNHNGRSFHREDEASLRPKSMARLSQVGTAGREEPSSVCHAGKESSISTALKRVFSIHAPTPRHSSSLKTSSGVRTRPSSVSSRFSSSLSAASASRSTSTLTPRSPLAPSVEQPPTVPKKSEKRASRDLNVVQIDLERVKSFGDAEEIDTDIDGNTIAMSREPSARQPSEDDFKEEVVDSYFPPLVLDFFSIPIGHDVKIKPESVAHEVNRRDQELEQDKHTLEIREIEALQGTEETEIDETEKYLERTAYTTRLYRATKAWSIGDMEKAKLDADIAKSNFEYARRHPSICLDNQAVHRSFREQPFRDEFYLTEIAADSPTSVIFKNVELGDRDERWREVASPALTNYSFSSEPVGEDHYDSTFEAPYKPRTKSPLVEQSSNFQAMAEELGLGLESISHAMTMDDQLQDLKFMILSHGLAQHDLNGIHDNHRPSRSSHLSTH